MKFFKATLAGMSAGFIMSVVSFAHAATYLPFGPQNDVLRGDVLNGGWTEVYAGDYGAQVAYDSMFNNLSDWVLIAAASKSERTFDLLAAIRVEDFNALPTGWNQTSDHNGAAWYRNGGSLGFAPAGASISQSSADTVDYNGGATQDQRLSWHTSGGYNNAPTFVNGGWRSGENVWLNSSTDFERFVFTASDADLGITAVPLPASGFLLIGALAGTAALRRRKKA